MTYSLVHGKPQIGRQQSYHKSSRPGQPLEAGKYRFFLLYFYTYDPHNYGSGTALPGPAENARCRKM